VTIGMQVGIEHWIQCLRRSAGNHSRVFGSFD
jgi:hypothetical protein